MCGFVLGTCSQPQYQNCLVNVWCKTLLISIIHPLCFVFFMFYRYTFEQSVMSHISCSIIHLNIVSWYFKGILFCIARCPRSVFKICDFYILPDDLFTRYSDEKLASLSFALISMQHLCLFLCYFEIIVWYLMWYFVEIK